MKCCTCNKEITFDNAYQCGHCGRTYCEDCANNSSMCGCYSDLERFN